MRYALLASLMILSCQMTAQLNGKYIFRHITQKDGLLHSSVLDIQQDDRGFIWIVTSNGLQRYDGHRFVNYPQVVNYPVDLVPNAGKLLIDTANQRVNMVVSGNMESLDLSTNTITTTGIEVLTRESPFIFERKDGQKSFMYDNCMSVYKNDSLIGSYIFADRERNTWLVRDSVSGDVFIPFSLDFGVGRKGSQILEFMTDDNPTHPLLVQLRQLEEDLPNMHFGQVKNIFLQHAMMDSYRNLWIIPWNEYLLRYNLNTQKLHYYDLQKIKERHTPDKSGDPVLHVSQMLEDRQHNLWVAIDNAGLALYDHRKDDFQFISSDDRISNGLEFSFDISTIYQDRDDNIWVGTDMGISIFNPYSNQIQIVRHQDGNPNSLPKNNIMDIIETSEGEILACTWGGGITVFDRQWNFKRQYNFEGGDNPNKVWCFVQHEDGTIWAGAQAGYVHIYHPVLRTFKTIRPPETGFSTIVMMEKDLNGNILMGLSGGKIAVWNQDEDKFYPYNVSDTNYLSTHASHDIFVDNQNQCWASFNFGIKKYDQEKQIFTGNYSLPLEGRDGRYVYGIEAYNDTLLLVGTAHAGLHLFNKRTFEFRPFLEKELPEYSTINAIKRDETGNFWFTSEFELYRLSAQMEFTRVHLGNSMIKSALGSSWFYELSDGRWVTSSWSELICFNPKDFGTNSTDLNLQVCGFKLFDQDMYIDSFLTQEMPVVLNHDQNFFAIEFSNLHFHDIRSINYYYRLSDVDRDWVRTETPKAEYTAIKPGEYIFEVKAEQGNGFSDVVSFSIMINPPWWATWWFRTICVIAMISLIAFLIRKRIQFIRKEADLKHRVSATEMMALRAQMNPHFIFNCINSIDAMIQSNDKYRATTYLNKFAKLIRNILDSSSHNKVPLSKDVETLRLYVELEQFRHENKFTAEIDVDEMLLQGEYKVPPLIIQPYVENAILHGLRNRPGNTGKLQVSISKINEHLLFRIEDNGVGRKTNGEQSARMNGVGLQLSSNRIRLFNDEDNASVEIIDLVEQGSPCGTRVNVRLKLK